MKLDKALFFCLIASLALALIFRWQTWSRILVAAAGVALLAAVVWQLISGGRRHE